jgi:micrococcal nuclease
MVRGFFVTFIIYALSCLPAYAWEGYVTGVLDGDSLRVKKGRRVNEIRLYGIDSPEYGQSYWQEARSLARELVLGQIVNIKPVDTDHYGRTVALVWHQGKLVNSELVRNGLAWVYPRYCQTQPLCSDMKTLEEAAQKQRLGLWREKSPMAPWLWRQLKY